MRAAQRRTLARSKTTIANTMARPPYSSAFPDTGGAPVPPYPQLMRPGSQPSTASHHRRSSLDPIQAAQAARRNSSFDDHVLPSPGRSGLPVQPGVQGNGGAQRHSAVPDYQRMLQMGGMQPGVATPTSNGSMQPSRPSVARLDMLGRRRTPSQETVNSRTVLPHSLTDSQIHESPDEGEGSDASSVMDDVVIEDVKSMGNKHKKAKTGDGESSSTGFGAGLASLGLSKEKRKRQVQSCSECRRRKIKCDKKWVTACGGRRGRAADTSVCLS